MEKNNDCEWVFRWSLVLAFVGGAAALGHQWLWTRRLIDLLGAGHEASARVFGVFFLGLALGSLVAAMTLERIRRPWRFLGWMEIAVGVLALPIALLPWWTGWMWPALGPEALLGGAGGWVKLAVSVVCLLPPSFCMGFFVPVVVRELGRMHAGDAGGRSLALYAANTLGGVAGLVLVAGVAVHAFGLMGAMIAVVVLNFAVAVGCLMLGGGIGFFIGFGAHRDTATCVLIRQERAGRECEESGPQRSTRKAGGTLALPKIGPGALAFFSGVAVLSAEVMLMMLLQLAVPVTIYGPAAMLALVIATLAVAAGVAALPWVRRRASPVMLGWVMLASALLWCAAPWVFHGLVANFPTLVKASTMGGFVVKLSILLAAAFGLAMLAAGLVFPLTAILTERGRQDDPGRSWGWLLACNGEGGLIGAELTVRWLLPVAGLHAAFGWLAMAYVVVALGLMMRGGWVVGVPVIVAMAMVVAIPGLARLPLVNPHVGFDVLEARAGRDGVVVVVEHPRIGRGMLVSNQYLLGSTSARWSQERQAHVPLMLHAAPSRVAFLGSATGNTPAAALDHAAVAALDVVEISPDVAELARIHFPELGGRLYEDARVRMVIEDGRTWVAANPETYDVIVADLFQPWGPGEGRLFSQEHFASARAALNDGGLFCQWLPGHQLAPAEFESIVATFGGVFGSVWIFVDGFLPMSPSIALIGWKDGTVDWDTVRMRCDAERLAGGVLDPVVRHAESIRLLHVATLEKFPSPAVINTLDNNHVELSAGRRLIRGEGSRQTMRGGAWLAWIMKSGNPTPIALRLHQAELGAFSRRIPLGAMPDGQALRQRLPAAIRADSGADWNRWPGTIFPRRAGE